MMKYLAKYKAPEKIGFSARLFASFSDIFLASGFFHRQDETEPTFLQVLQTVWQIVEKHID